MSNALLTIGAFSRASSLSVPTLRAYHQSGLLVPASIDPSSGYRQYSVDQLADAIAIVRLRDLDVPLPLVHQILAARDPDTTRDVLARHEDTMRERLSEAQRIIAALQDGAPRSTTPAHSFDTANVTTLECAATVPGAALWDWLASTIERLAAIAGDRLAAPSMVGALYTPAIEGDTHEDVIAFVAIEEPFLLDDLPATVDEIRIGEIPARQWAALSHTDGFATIGETYGILGAWVARNATPDDDAPICELYPNIGDDDGDDGVIEIRWPLAPPTTKA